MRQLHAYARAAGRDPTSIALTFRVPMQVLPSRSRAAAGDRPRFQGTAAQVTADVREYQALGVTHFVFDAVARDGKAILTNMERFANDVRPKIKPK